MSHPTDTEIAKARATAPHNVWLIAGTWGGEPYPCRCGEAKFGRCHPVFCPCAGRTDEALSWEGCCASRHTPSVVVDAAREYRIAKLRQGSGE